ncbi:hypothetical protein MMC28_010338 [Mycoblastus sanguinarius]|nr:hypothetical protein [Mycoblastus sanguinarius]
MQHTSLLAIGIRLDHPADKIPRGKSKSRFIVDEKDNLRPQALTFEGKSIDYFSVYDVLGWFMTVIGPAPKDATKENYLVPMSHLFCRWSTEFADGNEPPRMSSIVHLPSISQSLISVDVWGDSTPDVALGATMAANKNIVFDRSFKRECRQRRFALLQKFGFGVENFPDQRILTAEPQIPVLWTLRRNLSFHYGKDLKHSKVNHSLFHSFPEAPPRFTA